MDDRIPTQMPNQNPAITGNNRDDPMARPMNGMNIQNMGGGSRDFDQNSRNEEMGASIGNSADNSDQRLGNQMLNQNTGSVSAVFDTDDQARDAISELRSEGINDACLSLITQNRGTTTTADADGAVVDEEHTSLLRGILGGGALGAGLGVAALAIPGVGPLVAAGAIASATIPSALAIGGAAGAAMGTLNETLKGRGISDDDATYYGEQMKTGGVLVLVENASASAKTGSRSVEEILYANGGHNFARANAG